MPAEPDMGAGTRGAFGITELTLSVDGNVEALMESVKLIASAAQKRGGTGHDDLPLRVKQPTLSHRRG